MCVCVCVHTCVCAKLLQLCPTLWPYGLYPTRLLCPWDSSGKKTGVVARTFSRGSSRPRCRTHLFSYVGRWFEVFLFVFATRVVWEACFGCISWESAIYPGNVILFSIWELVSIIYHSNNLKKKNHLILSEGIENNYWPNSTSIPDKPPQKNSGQRNLLQFEDGCLHKTTANFLMENWIHKDQDKYAHSYHTCEHHTLVCS